ncbi:aminotransferase class I and II [Fibrella aestuarina BUZ 2]|uniref:Aminotransferase class I and II n=1 Tax=Fibrella aestuarina BUZ 2 TaxID=1166018 RepID=I0KG48_9BACT|nr:aminotransferase class I/II-fold pyridoxal phosphate-dependent enzyme [Fibrella aestuarina]CCH03101.1 aminotransferase class I and II [Fibrella aestuarina BUZ 2]
MNHPFTIDQQPNRTIVHSRDGGPERTYLFFSGTSYLGIAQHPQMQALLTEGIARYGLHFGSSRNGNLQLAIYEEAEQKLALWTGAAAALTTSSGMVAGQVVVDWLARQPATDALVLQTAGTHPALWHPLLKAQTVPFTPEGLLPALDPADQRPLCILTNSVDALRGEYYDFSWLSSIRHRRVLLVVDDSHGIGVLHGRRGIYPELAQLVEKQLPNVTFVVTASLAKAMGLPGGVILGPSLLIENLRRTAYFGACSPMPPAYAYAFVHAGPLYKDARKRLDDNVTLAEKRLIPTGLFTHGAGYPVFYTDHDELYPKLLKQGIFIYSFAYPTPADKANTRIVISAYHEPNDIDKLAEAIQHVL